MADSSSSVLLLEVLELESFLSVQELEIDCLEESWSDGILSLEISEALLVVLSMPLSPL
jgi:hypothetical protein